MIGRANELQELFSLCEKKTSSLVAIYGRRRIGKTYLINYMFKQNKEDCIFFEFTGSYDIDKKIQLKNFIEAIYEWFKIVPNREIEDWTDAFNFLKRAIDTTKENTKYKKVVIFFDEVPWIDKHDKQGFLSALGHFWNVYCEKKEDVVMILCGSNASWIKKKILNDGFGPHHKRIDKVIHLKPFTLKETKEYLLNEKNFDIDDKSVTEIYMIFGGVAKYLSYLESDKTIAENIDDIFFSSDGLLFGEYLKVFDSLFQDKAKTHKTIMDLLVEKQSGFTITEITSSMGLNNNNTRVKIALDELVDCGFITTIIRYGNAVRDSKYIVSDPFCLFYKKWVSPLSKNEVSRLSKYWEKNYGTQAYAVWSGFAFELVSIVNIDLYTKERGMSGVYKGVSYWNYVASKDSNDKGAQIDMLVEYDNDVYDIVECKYYNDEFIITKDYAANLKNKKDMFIKHGLSKKKYDIKMVMLTSYGTTKNSHYNNLNINADITLDALLK